MKMAFGQGREVREREVLSDNGVGMLHGKNDIAATAR